LPEVEAVAVQSLVAQAAEVIALPQELLVAVLPLNLL
jgi:hypothetical protein